MLPSMLVITNHSYALFKLKNLKIYKQIKYHEHEVP